jgi:hypothetical protein
VSGLAAYLVAFGATVVIEAIVSVLFGCRTARDLGVTALVNGITHPVMWAIVLGVAAAAGPGNSILWVILVLEIGVVFAEFQLLRWALPPGRPRLFQQSLAMNAASLLIGAALAL